MKARYKGYVLWIAAALMCAGAILIITDTGPAAGLGNVASAVLVALLIVGALYLVIRAIAARQSNVIERGPEMSSLAFPPSSFGKLAREPGDRCQDESVQSPLCRWPVAAATARRSCTGVTGFPTTQSTPAGT
jgi:hypothetical protein